MTICRHSGEELNQRFISVFSLFMNVVSSGGESICSSAALKYSSEGNIELYSTAAAVSRYT